MAGGRMRKSVSIYEAYPLSAPLAPRLPPPLERALSQQRLASDDTMAARRLHELLVDDGTTARESAAFQRQRGERRSANMCSRLGKFTGEVYETKERSHMINVLKRRSRTPAEPGATKFTADDVLRAGTLTKQGSWRRNWKTRFFLLRQDVPSLSYYKSEEKLELLGAIAISGDTLVLDKSNHGHAPYRFQLRTDAASLLLETETRDNQQRWMDACQQLIDALRAEKFRQSTVFADRDPTTAARHRARPTAAATLRHSVATTAATSTSSAPSILRVRTPGRIGADDLNEFLAGSSDSSSDEEDNADDDEGDEDEEEEEEFEDNQKDEEEEEDLWATSRSQFLVVLDEKTTRQNQLQVQQTKLQRRASTPVLPTKVASKPGAYDLVLELAVGRHSKLLSRSETAGDKLRCCVKVVGYNATTKATAELGTTDAVRIAPAAAAQQTDSSPIRVTFSVVLPADLSRFDQLRFTLYRTTTSTSGRATVGLGRCFIDDNLTTLGAPRIVALAEKSSSFHDLLSNKTTEPPPSLRVAPTKTNSSVSLVPLDSNAVHIVVQAFPAVPLQTVLPTSGVDMAASKYLLPTTLTSEDDAVAMADNNVMMQAFVENGSFLTSGSEAPSHARLIVVDEILRAPRSTFALPLAFLDFLEETALERVRVLQKQVDADGDKETSTLATVELEFYRKKLEEYLRQRQFLMKQEKRLVDEASDSKVFAHAAHQVLAMSVKTKSKTGAVDESQTSADATELVAPFKRSTYKSLDLWQFLPTNMQDQFLCVHQPQNPTQFVWHTMTMGCPAAHTKGFTNGGFPSTTSVIDASRASHSGYSDDDAQTASENEHERASLLGTQLGRRSRSSNSSSNPANDGTDSVSTLRSRLELKDRLDIIASQTLSAAIACILASLDLAVLGSETHKLQLANATRFGFLIHFESLLSTQGKEVGMLEDFAAGAKWLRNVFVQFRRHNPKNSVSGQYFSVKTYAPPERRGAAGGTGLDGAYNPSASAMRDTSSPPAYLIVTVGVTDAQLEVLPTLLASGKPFRMRCVLFTQGVNEKQSLVHALKSQTVKVQDRINRENLEELKEIYNIFRRVHDADNVARDRISKIHADARGENCISRYNLETLDDLLTQIEQHVCSSSNQFKKNVALLMDTSDFCRELGGARVTCCKSGKDRTAMSVTLEQARLCCSRLRVAQSHGKKLCATMRLYGVRRKNVFLNTKSSKFAFNEMQRKMLPDCYKPPVGTYKSGKT